MRMLMTAAAVLGAVLGLAGPAAAQMKDMPGMETPPAPAPAADDPHAGHNMSGMAQTEADIPKAPPPPVPADHAADAYYSPAEMAAARRTLNAEHGAIRTSMILFNLAEYQARQGSDGYRWEGEGWFGGDINRFVVKTEGEGNFGGPFEDAELQALYSRAIGPWFNLQAGVRHDIRPRPQRTYATLGFEGIAPYWFKVGGALFVSDKGDLLARFEGYYDQRITQKLILQPRTELNFAAQDVPETGVGSGLSDVEIGVRLRYEIVREFAPYAGIEWVRKVGDTARYARLAGEDSDVVNFVAGIRFWF